MMTKTEFIEELSVKLHEKIGNEEAQIKTYNMDGLNRHYLGMCIRIPGDNISPVINVDSLYQQYKDAPTDVRSIDTVADAIIAKHPLSVEFDLPANDLYHFDKVKNNLMVRLVNTERNRSTLEHVLHEDFLDLSVVLVVKMGISPGKDLSTWPVPNTIYDEWVDNGCDLSPRDIIWDTIDRLSQSNPLSYYPLIDMVMEVLKRKTTDMPEALRDALMPDPHDLSQYISVVTTEDTIYGAVVLLYDTFKNYMAKKIGRSCYILPSSIHEVMVVPENSNVYPSALRNIVRETNMDSGVISAEEFLSNSVYYFNGKDIVIADW